MSKKATHFEDSLKSLEQIVDSLESGQLSLEESLSAFEKGMTIGKACQQTLKEAEQRIEKLMEDHKTMVEVTQDELSE